VRPLLAALVRHGSIELCESARDEQEGESHFSGAIF
jgi:hypothetical protein